MTNFVLEATDIVTATPYNIDWAINNSGQTEAVIDSVQILYKIGTYTGINPVVVNSVILQDSTLAGVTTLSATLNSATGGDSLWAKVYYTNLRNSVSRIAEFRNQGDVWSITGAADYSLDFVSTEFSNVSQGQDSVLFTVQVTNSGLERIRLDSLKLLPMIPANYNTSTLYLGPDTLDGGGLSYSYSLYADILPSALIGVDTMKAHIYGETILTSQIINNAEPGQSQALVIQARPDIIVDSTLFTSDSLVHGEELNLTLSISQLDTALTTATSTLDSVILYVNNQELSTQNIITGNRLVPPNLPLAFAPGNSVNIQYDLKSGNTNGQFPVYARLVFVDNNDSTSFMSYSDTTLITILQPANVVVSQIQMANSQVTLGQDSVLAEVFISNTGQSPAVIPYYRLNFDTSGVIVNPGW